MSPSTLPEVPVGEEQASWVDESNPFYCPCLKPLFEPQVEFLTDQLTQFHFCMCLKVVLEFLISPLILWILFDSIDSFFLLTKSETFGVKLLFCIISVQVIFEFYLNFGTPGDYCGYVYINIQ